ncbi:uncharacterized protein K452DRAFT_19231 [Aplosporella prunicola CBS 121167]|uniref:Uncharacterized protein n=1 Tax=Aplosporella prunicola CBS 121167 TaxID=1176127 RepID=A0A6A6BIS3_9PEZI|nr:uncharacterized protein K452DRAFT_19231 [Aplosporella prunicola CBS 121167]KAF2142461.1 hypothetical protein K452DRAFT_19231 [Aplosporella prunicola CBS 121167]
MICSALFALFPSLPASPTTLNRYLRASSKPEQERRHSHTLSQRRHPHGHPSIHSLRHQRHPNGPAKPGFNKQKQQHSRRVRERVPGWLAAWGLLLGRQSERPD